MKSSILEKGEGVFTHLKKIFDAIDNQQINYNWLITDIECYPNNKKYEEFFSHEYVWITGEKLTEIIEDEDICFIWCVFSGFTNDINLEDVLKYDLH